jgi:membrane protein
MVDHIFSSKSSFKIIRSVNFVFSVLVVTAWFTIVCIVLPDAIVHWKVALVGGLLTALLFTLGKWILGHLLDYSNMVTIFGTFASVLFILLFIFYSSLILYYGASFTYSYADATNRKIVPRKRALRSENGFSEIAS